MRGLILVGAAVLLLAGCATNPENRRAFLMVSMNGVQEVPGPGDPDANGTVEIRVNPATAELCWDLYARAIDPATMAHIHRGGAGASGPPVVTFTTPDAAGRSQGCTTIAQPLAQEIAWRGHEFYVNVHNAAYPQGAMRGQLRGGPEPREPRQAQQRRSGL